MGLADEFEKRLERVVEGFFSKAFRSEIQPAEIGRRLLREMEGGKTVSVGEVYVPNRYRVRLTAEDRDRFSGLEKTLTQQFAKLLQEAARERRWKLPGAVGVEFETDEAVRKGEFETQAAHEEGAQPPIDTGTAAALRLSGEDGRRWMLTTDEITIGRLEECDVVLADPNVSRRHAKLERRDGQWWVFDLGATNGTLVNDALVRERPLRSGDRLSVGTTELEFIEEEPVEG